MATRIQLRRGTSEQWALGNPVMAEGEVGVETDTHRIKFGDGINAWTGLPYSTMTPEDIHDAIENSPVVVQAAADATTAAAPAAVSAELSITDFGPYVGPEVDAHIAADPAFSAAADAAVTTEIAGRDIIEWRDLRGPVPTLVAVPNGVRTQDGPITPTFSGTVPVIEGDEGPAWVVGADNGTTYTYMVIPNTEGWFTGAASGTILLRAKYRGVSANVAAGYLFSITNAAAGEYMNIGRMDSWSNSIGNSPTFPVPFPTDSYFDYIIRWGGGSVTVERTGGRRETRAYTTPPKSGTDALFRFPTVYGTDAYSEVEVAAFVAFDEQLTDEQLDLLEDAEGSLTWAAVRKALDDAWVADHAATLAQGGSVLWSEYPHTVPSLLLTPGESRDRAGALDPGLTGPVTVEAGTYGDAWRLGQIDGSSYTNLSLRNDRGFLSASTGTLILRVKDNGGATATTQVLAGVTQGVAGTYLNAGYRGGSSVVGDGYVDAGVMPSGAVFTYAVRWDETTLRADIVGVGSGTAVKTTAPYAAPDAVLQFPLAYGSPPQFDISLEGVLAFDAWVDDAVLDAVDGIAGPWTWRDVIAVIEDATASSGIPPGGATGSVLTKQSATDGDVAWGTPASADAVAAFGRRTVAFGDSITAGSTGAEAGGYLHPLSWYTWMLHYTEGRFEHVRNAAIPGDTLQGMQARLDADVLAYDPDIVFFMAGANNVGSLTPAQAAAIYEDIIVRILAAGSQVVLCTLTPRDGTGTNSINTDKYSAVVRRLGAKYGLQVLDNTTPLIDPATGDFAAGMANDGLHPTMLGAVTLGREAARQLESYPPTFLANLATSATDYANLLVNGIFLGDSNSDGVADGWTLSGPSGTVLASLEADPAIVGNWQVLDKTVAGYKVLSQALPVGTWTPGDRLRFSGRVSFDYTGDGVTGGLHVGIRYTGGTPDRLSPLFNVQADLEPGVFNVAGIVPAGTTAASVQIDIGIGTGTGKAKLAQLSVINETALGIA